MSSWRCSPWLSSPYPDDAGFHFQNQLGWRWIKCLFCFESPFLWSWWCLLTYLQCHMERKECKLAVSMCASLEAGVANNRRGRGKGQPGAKCLTESHGQSAAFSDVYFPPSALLLLFFLSFLFPFLFAPLPNNFHSCVSVLVLAASTLPPHPTAPSPVSHPHLAHSIELRPKGFLGPSHQPPHQSVAKLG